MAIERRNGSRGRRRLSGLVTVPLLIFSVWVEAGVVKTTGIVAGAILTASVIAVWLVERGEHHRHEHEPGEEDPPPRRPPELVRRHASQALGAMIGAAVVFSAWSLAGWSQTRLSACEPPSDLRVMTSPESLRAIRQVAERFAAHQAAGRRCRPVHVTVFPAPPMVQLRDAFRNGWTESDAAEPPGLVTIGPRPDVWLPSSGAIARLAADEGTKGAELRFGSSDATTPVVLAAPAAVYLRLRDEVGAAAPWETVIDALRRMGVGLLRPGPETSDFGTVATMSLYGEHVGDGAENGARERHDREQWVSPPDTPLQEVDDMICDLRSRLAGNPRATVAAMVPEHSLAGYNSGAPLGGSCSRQLPVAQAAVQRLVPYRPSDTRRLDYPLIRVIWQDERDTRRERQAEDFAGWLAKRAPLGGEGFDRAGSGDATLAAKPVSTGELARTLTQIAATRRPRTVLFALDRSASMDAPVSGGTALGRARDLISDALRWLGGNDRAGLWAFPAGRDGREPVRLAGPGPALRDTAAAAIRAELYGPRTAAEGVSTPLHHAVAEGIAELRGRPGGGSLVVLTDGDNDDAGHATADLPALEHELRSSPSVRVYLVVAGERGCDGRLRALFSDPPRSRCLAFGPSSSRRDVLSDLFTDIWKD